MFTLELSNKISWKDIYGNKNFDELTKLAQDVRNFLIYNAKKTKGHLGSDLGVVEITLGLLKNYSLDDSIILFDTGHQSHVYKMFTDRMDLLELTGKQNGISNFQELNESKYDKLSNGHSSTALSYAAGYSQVTDKENIIVVIGDGSLMSGLSFEGLINISNLKGKKVTVVYNDNEESIGDNVLKIKNPKMFFESLGFSYDLIEDGNNLKSVDNKISLHKDKLENTVLHFKTKKAFGYSNDVPLFLNHTFEKQKEYKFPDLVKEIVEENFDSNTYLTNPSMLHASTLVTLKEKYPNNIFDVGINEATSSLLATVFAIENKKSILSIYSSFMQRIYDQLVHDVFRNNVRLLTLVDRAGLSSYNGISHHGIYDVSMINNFNTAIILHPYTDEEYKTAYKLFDNVSTQLFIRYENKKVISGEKINYEIGEWSKIIFDKENTKTIFAFGSALQEFKNKIEDDNLKINLINARFIKPVDLKLLKELEHTEWFVYEQLINKNNLATNLQEAYPKKLIKDYSFKNNKINHGSELELLEQHNLDYDFVINDILEY